MSSAHDIESKILAENEKKVRLGLLLVTLGVAHREEVFPSGIKQVPQLRNPLKGHVSEHRSILWRAMGWLGFGGARSSQHRIAGAGRRDEGSPHVEKMDGSSVDPMAVAQARAREAAVEAAERHHREVHAQRMGKNVATADDTASSAAPSSTQPTALAADVHHQQRRKGGKRVSLGPLDDATVEHLPVEVAQSRQRLYDSEEIIHGMLSSVEETRYKYLAPNPNPVCEQEIEAVTKCYEQNNKAFDEILKSGQLKPGTVFEEVLQCGTLVSTLKKCALSAAREHTLGEVQAPLQSQ